MTVPGYPIDAKETESDEGADSCLRMDDGATGRDGIGFYLSSAIAISRSVL